MDNYELLANAIKHHPDIVTRRKNPILPLVFILVGCVMAFLSLRLPMLVDDKNLSSALMLIGGLLAFFGIFRLITSLSGRIPVFAPTGEQMRRKEFFYEAADKSKLLEAFSSKDMARISRIPRGQSSNVVLMTYSTSSGSCVLAQVQEYVPHEFVPVTDVVRFS